jgi:hypothetical protein
VGREFRKPKSPEEKYEYEKVMGIHFTQVRAMGCGFEAGQRWRSPQKACSWVLLGQHLDHQLSAKG